MLLLTVVLGLAICFQEPLQQKWQGFTEKISRPEELFGGQRKQTPENSEKPLPESIAVNGAYYYAYRQLSEEEKTVYAQFLTGVTQMQEEFEVATRDTETVDHAYDAILADHPELFWMGGYTVVSYLWGDTVHSLKVEPEYFYSPEEKEDARQRIEEEADRIVGETLANFDNEYQRVRHIYEYIINRVDYDPEAKDNQNICSVFLNARSVCMGYAKGFQYLLQKMGMECTTVAGTADGEAHAWDLVRMEGEYYYVDPTWGDTNFSDPEEERNQINYVFFGMNTEELEKTHIANEDIRLPVCTAQNCNYYVREGLLYESFDPEVIGDLIWETQENGGSAVTFRFTSREAYEAAKRYFIEENRVFDYCYGTANISYRDDGIYNAMTIYY